MSRRARRLAVGGVVVALAAGGALIATRHASATPQQQYLTAAVGRGNVALSVQVTGVVAPLTTYDLGFGAASSGSGSSGGTGSGGSGSSGGGSVLARSSTVAAVDVTPGQVVKGGATLATESSAVADEQLVVAQAELAAAQARQAAEVLNPLPGTQAAVADATNLAATDAAQQALSAAQAAVAATTITAPADGIVLSVNVAVGQSPPSGPAIVLRSANLAVSVDVAEVDLADVAVHEQASVSIPAIGQILKGSVAAMPTEANPQPANPAAAAGTPVTFPVTIGLAQTPSGVLPGMSANVTIVKATRQNVLTVPTTAIHGQGKKAHVELMTNGTPKRQVVVLGLVTSTMTQIISGLSAGQTVITGVVNPVLSTSLGGKSRKSGGLGGGFRAKGGGKGARGGGVAGG